MWISTTTWRRELATRPKLGSPPTGADELDLPQADLLGPVVKKSS